MVNNNIVIENAKIGFRNFSGKAAKFNPAGRRNFCVFLDKEHGLRLEQDGWNVRWLQPREEGEDMIPYLQVTVSYDNIVPKIVLVTKKRKTILDDISVDELDTAEIENVDLIIRPYNWSVNGSEGVKAYCKSMYVTIVEDEFAEKYYD
jgi:hypothetical protein